MGYPCCRSGPLNVTVRTDRIGYCVGELMTITVYANNQTPYRILGVEVELIQDTIYVSQGGKQKPMLTKGAKDYSLQVIMLIF